MLADAGDAVTAIVSDSFLSVALEILSVSDNVSESERLIVPDKAISVSRDIDSASEISAILDVLSVSEIISDSGTVLIPALLALSVSVIVSDT